MISCGSNELPTLDSHTLYDTHRKTAVTPSAISDRIEPESPTGRSLVGVTASTSRQSAGDSRGTLSAVKCVMCDDMTEQLADKEDKISEPKRKLKQEERELRGVKYWLQ